MKRFAQFFFIISVLFFTTLPLYSCEPVIENTEPDSETIHVGDKLPFFTIKTSQGDSLSTNDLLGKPTVLVFFHTMCGDCQRELPVVESLYQKYGKEVRFICISREQTDEEVAAKVTELAATYGRKEEELKANVELMENIKDSLKSEKAIKLLVDEAKVKEVAEKKEEKAAKKNTAKKSTAKKEEKAEVEAEEKEAKKTTTRKSTKKAE